MRVVGVDENGLGPRLGPLLATAIGIETEVYDNKALRALGIELGIDDSKRVSGFGRMAHAEGLALAIVESLVGQMPQTSDEMFAALSLDSVESLQAPCPTEAFAQCWRQSTILALPAFGGNVDNGRSMLGALHDKGITLWSCRSVVVCAGVLNRHALQGNNRLRVNLTMFERLLQQARHESKTDLHAICGMVGGIRCYPNYVRHFDRADLQPLSVVKGHSSYQIPGFGELHFKVDADRDHLPVALASMVGKYLRELSMLRLQRFYAEHDPSLPVVSGYHDPRTEEFVQRTASLRERLKIVSQCFER